MNTDPRRHLITLISLVAYTDTEGCGLRPPYRRETEEDLTDSEGAVAHEMCMHYAGAVEHVRGDNSGAHELDYEELVDFTLKFVTNASSDAEYLIGTILEDSLHLLMGTNPRIIGRKWLDNVIDTCWSIKLSTARERFGLYQ